MPSHQSLTLAACGDSEETTSTSTAAATTASTAAPTGEQVLIRVTTPVPAGDDFLAWAQEGMDKFNARTNGAYKMEIFPGGQLGPVPGKPGCHQDRGDRGGT